MIIRDFTKFLKEYFLVPSGLVGVEVGVQKGANALEMSEYLKPRMLVLVDAWNETIERGNTHCSVDPNDGRIDIGETQEKHLLYTYRKFADRIDVIIVKGLSQQVANLFRAGFDFVYIDAGHDYNNMRQDITCWYPLVRDMGVLGGHDYHMPDVAKAVNEAFPNTKIYTGIERPQQGVDWWVIKS